MVMKQSQWAKLTLAGLALAMGGWANAQAVGYPGKAITIVVPFPPGGGIDVLVRTVGKELSERWQQPVVIENKGGASTFIGAEAVARAKPDGYTLLATTDPTFTANRHLFAKLPYDPDKDFAPVIQMVRGDSVVVAHPSVPVKDFKELVAMAKDKDSKLSYASYGNGTQPQQFFGALNAQEGTDILHVPYKGISPAVTAVLAKEVDVGLASAGVLGEMIKAGRVKPLAVAGDKRLAQFPNIPTTVEQGYPKLKSAIWYGVFAPAGTPPEIVNKLNTEIAAILKRPDFAAQHVTSKGLSVVAGTPKELQAATAADSANIGAMIKAANIKPE
jgi:tripartite-type tricarboxylate transporter receptor subunit TctC